MDDVEEYQPGEAELELAVFGDRAGFRTALNGSTALVEAGSAEDDEDLEGLDDDALFFLDDGADGKAATGALSSVNGQVGGARNRVPPPVWHDSDDEKMSVSLLSNTKLRKLRHFEGEDIVPGNEYIVRLRQQYEILHPRPDWADWQKGQKHSRQADSDEDSAEDDDAYMEEDADLSVQPLMQLMRSTEALVKRDRQFSDKRVRMRSEVIAIERMKDILPNQPSAITSISLHPTIPLILSSGLSSTLYLHYLRPHPTPPDPANPLLISLHLKHTPLSTTAFSPAPRTANQADPASAEPKIYLSSRRRYFHVWDMPSGEIKKITRVYGQQDTQRSMEVLKPSPCGRYVALKGSSRKGGGVINFLDAHTLQWIAQTSIESRKGVADFAWWSDGRGMSIIGRGGEVNEWAMEERKVIARWTDEGAMGITTLAIGGRNPNTPKKGTHWPLGPDRWIAIGSTSGIVNIYERTTWLSASQFPIGTAKPTKMLDNLVTPISHLAFSPCGQILAMGSRWKRDALRLVHLPTCTVYKNWPTSKTPLGRISAVAMGEYDVNEDEKRIVLCIGNEAGALRGWEIAG